jgi:hypothetical protein
MPCWKVDVAADADRAQSLGDLTRECRLHADRGDNVDPGIQRPTNVRTTQRLLTGSARLDNEHYKLLHKCDAVALTT